MCEAMSVVPEVGIRSDFGGDVDECSNISSLVDQANRYLSSMAALGLHLEGLAQGDRALDGMQVRELARRVRVLENMLYDRCI
ncbi:MAG: hypothetical protein HQL81_10110 [Magnetococcales bacterium]|nr:hypothetical protein [Magnetococcales bacterium]